ncbi:MAG TPA: methylenetetrahydrofolate reductase [Candidatus Methanomethylophilaceae archaeon]|nr:methylenetetrahydrofolate reductase [Candidatus Methanomethylophilaceae archaeon]
MKADSILERLLERGEFVVTSEISPPKSADGTKVREKVRILRGYADAFNVTDNQTAIVRMSSLAASLFCIQEGVEPIMQMTCRDRNRLAMQSDLIGASALGIRNLLCITGDHQRFGNQPQSRNVFDLDSTQQLMVFKRMRDEGELWCGDVMETAPKILLGAAANPFVDPIEMSVIRLSKKIKAGADFVQTQAIFDLDRFQEWYSVIRSRGLEKKTHIIAGVTPLRSYKAAKFMAENIPGMSIPEEVLKRMASAPDEKLEGTKICLERIEVLRDTPGIHGIHLMPINWESVVPEIMERAELLPRPSP